MYPDRIVRSKKRLWIKTLFVTRTEPVCNVVVFSASRSQNKRDDYRAIRPNWICVKGFVESKSISRARESSSSVFPLKTPAIVWVLPAQLQTQAPNNCLVFMYIYFFFFLQKSDKRLIDMKKRKRAKKDIGKKKFVQL